MSWAAGLDRWHPTWVQLIKLNLGDSFKGFEVHQSAVYDMRRRVTAQQELNSSRVAPYGTE